MVGITERIFGRGSAQEVKTTPVNGNNRLEHFLSFKNLKLLFGVKVHKNPLEKYTVNIKYNLSEDFMTKNHNVLQYLVKQQAEDEKQLLDDGNINEKSDVETNLSTTSILDTPIVHKCPSSKQLLNRPWLIKIQNNIKGEPPTLKCYGIDEEGNVIQVEGKPSLITPTLDSKARVESWKPKHWKPIQQTLQLHEITPSPKCPKHQHLQESKKYELTRETLLQATIFTTKQEVKEEIKQKVEPLQNLAKELTKIALKQRLHKLSTRIDKDTPLWIPPKWEPPKDEIQLKDGSSRSSESDHGSESNSSEEKESNVLDSFKEKPIVEEEEEKKLKKKRLEEKKKKKEMKKKIQNEKRQWGLAIREAVNKNAFAGTYGATRAGGVGRLF